MAEASDKARFYLEQIVPELREYERKKIFSKEEIASIAKKRSDFEHKINARGPQPSDFAKYAEYEMNLDALRRKRIKRLGVKSTQMHTGQRRVFFILDRATRKFHGDISLWMQYIEYARRQRAFKKLDHILTSALRLHPTQVELWIYAARYALEDHADMLQARSYMQRGLRFCKNSKLLWLQYAKLEMIYISRIAARQKILGIDGSRKAVPEVEMGDGDSNADMIKLPQVTGEDINPTTDTDEANQQALQTLNNTPALSGAIPIAVFDAAMGHFGNDDALGCDFYNMICEFEGTPCMRRVLEHVVESMITKCPLSARAQVCHIRFPVAGVPPTSADFPRAFAMSLTRLKEHSKDGLTVALAEEVAKWLRPLVAISDLDPALCKVLRSTLGSAERVIKPPQAG
ncbi:hypothetical protein VTO42DRAFT_8589 [Malbranchea cinnamomea]